MSRGWLTVVLLCCSLPGAAAQDKERLKADEDLLRGAGVALDGDSLLEFFRARTPGEKALQGIEGLIRDLGNDAFKVRQRASDELIRIGPQALTALRPMASSADPEVAFRVRTCIGFLEQSVRPDLMAAAVRVLADRRPAGATKVLLAHLPAADDSYVIEEIHNTLAVVGVRGGKGDETLKAALEDKHPRRRAAAGEAIARAGKAEDRAALRPLLRDPDVRVRLAVGIALVERKEREAVETLIEALAEAPQEQFWRVEQILFALAGDDAPKVSPGSSDVEKRDYRSAWRTWWQAKGDKVDLAALDNAQRTRGLTLIVQYDGARAGGLGGRAGISGRVYEVGPDGKTRWEIKDLHYPIDAQVVGGDRVLVAEYRSRQVTERNLKGEAVWTKALDNYPVSVQRTDNGNTLIADRVCVMEVNRAGTELSRWQTPGNLVIGARKARNGETVVLDSAGTVYRLDAKGRVAKTTRLGVVISTVIGTQFDVLPNGHVLVPLYSQNKVMEFDADGKRVWEAAAERPTACSRLPSGNTLISSRYGRNVVEIDRTGKQVWTFSSPTGSVLHARRR